MSARPSRDLSPRRRADEVEVALMKRLAAGDLAALGELYDRHGEDVRRFAFRVAGRLDVAEDLTHDAFLTLAQVAHRYDGEHPVRSFAIGIAARLLRRRGRRLAQRLKHLVRLRDSAPRELARTPEDDASSHEDLDRFRAALARLPEAKRLVLLMADVEGLSGKQIAVALDIPIGTVWTRLHYARAELRKVLAPARAAPRRTP